MFYVLAGAWGLVQGASIANLLGFIHGFCAPEQLAVLFGLYMFAEGVGSLGGLNLIGKFLQREIILLVFRIQRGIILVVFHMQKYLWRKLSV